DALHVHELADAELRKLAPVARAFDAAEGEARVGLDEAVHEHAARLDRRREALGTLPARGPEGRAEPEGRVVREANGVLLVARANHGRHRAEGLLVEGGHPLVDGGQDGGRVEGTGAARHAPAEQEARAALDRLLDLAAAGPPSTVPQSPPGRAVEGKTRAVSRAQRCTLEAIFKFPE